MLAGESADYRPAGFVFCRWAQLFKPRKAADNPERALKLTAENLFLTLADPANEPIPGNTPLLQFLALMLERKRVLRPRGLTEDGARDRYEHVKTHQVYEITAGELTPEFFVRIQEQLGVLVGTAANAPRRTEAATPAGAEAPAVEPPSGPEKRLV